MPASRTILIVDDDPAVRMVLDLAFEMTEHATVLATNGGEALAAVHTHHPDLMLLDVGMPDIDGLEVCRRVKGDPTTRHIKVVMLTARAQDWDRNAGMAAGADGYMTKPFSPKAVVAYVEETLATS